MAGVGAASEMTMGAMPAPARILAASATKLSPRKRGSRPTRTRWGSGCVLTYAAMPAMARRMLASVNSSATMALQPEVPNLMTELIDGSPQAALDPQYVGIRMREPQGTYCNTGVNSASLGGANRRTGQNGLL